MDVIRVGEKLVSRGKINRMIDRILSMRSAGKSQQEVANQLGIDRTFISRLEAIGEVSKGKRIALVGFPVLNKDELIEVARSEGVDYTLLLTDDERWNFLDKSGVELFNQIMEFLFHFRECDTVIFIGSDLRVNLAESILGPDAVIGVCIGASPIKGNVYVDPERIRKLVRSVRASD